MTERIAQIREKQRQVEYNAVWADEHDDIDYLLAEIDRLQAWVTRATRVMRDLETVRDWDYDESAALLESDPLQLEGSR